MTYAKKSLVDKGYYTCTICPSMKKPQNPANMRRHIASKTHMGHVAYQDLRNLDSNIPETTFDGPDSGLMDMIVSKPPPLLS